MAKTYLVTSKIPPASDRGTLLRAALETANGLHGVDVAMVKNSAAQAALLYFAVNIPDPAVLEQFKEKLGSTIVIAEWQEDRLPARKPPRPSGPG